MNNSTNIDEKQLLLRLRDGDHSAFEELYFKYSPQLLIQLDHKLQDNDQSNDIVQELFIKIWERRSQIDPDKVFGGYLFRIAQRMLIDHYRRLARINLLISDSILIQPDSSYRTDDSLNMKETQKILDEAMEKLTPQQRLAFQLCKMQGKSYKEAAELMEISSETLHSHLVKATKTVKSYIINYHKDIPGFLAFALIFYM